MNSWSSADGVITFCGYQIVLRNLRKAEWLSAVRLYTPACSSTLENTMPTSFSSISQGL